MKSMNFIQSFFFLTLCFFSFSENLYAASTVKAVEMKLETPQPSLLKNWVFSDRPKFKGPKELNELFKIRVLEVDGEWIECSSKSLNAAAKKSDLRGWIAAQGLDCLSQINKPTKESVSLAEKWFSFLEDHLELLGNGAWKEALIANLIKVQAQNIQTKKNGILEANKFLEEVLEFRGLISKTDLAEIYYSIAENLMRDKNAEAANYYFQRSYSLNPTKELAERLKSRGIPTVKTESIVEISDADELNSYRKAMEGLEKNKASVDVEASVQFLKSYPGSIKAQSVADKTITVVQSLVDRIDELTNGNGSNNGSSNGSSLGEIKSRLEKAMSQLLECHPLRLLDWAKILHRKGGYQEARRLAEKALPSLEDSSNGASLLYILGRTNHFIGDYQAALNYFSKIVAAHSGFSEIGESRFRMGLLEYRLNNFAKAVDRFRAAINSPDSSNYELSARYWLIRSLEKQGKDSAEEVKALFDHFPVSYYGFKLFSEKFGNPLVWPRKKIAKLKTNVWMTSSDQKCFERVKKLIQVGWYFQAGVELNQLYLPPTAENKVLMASWYAKAMSFPSAMKLISDATDMDIKYRAPEYLELVYPFLFQNEIEVEAKKNGLSPYLVVGLIRQESAFLLKAVSTSQAQGLMQMIPPTALEVAQDLKIKNFNPSDIFNPKINIQFGTHYIAKMIRKYENNIPLGLAAYNAGPVRLRKYLFARNDTKNLSQLSNTDYNTDLWIEELPWFETNLYVKSILRNAMTYQILESGKTEVQNPFWAPFIFQKK